MLMNNKSAYKQENNELTRVRELVYEVRVKEVMSAAEVVTTSPYTTMAELMTIMRINRISGVPVVEGETLVGIISLEDLIKAIADHQSDDTVGNHMSRKVISVRADDLAVQAVNLFAQYGYGRLPVLDHDGKLVGILTGGDITRGLLRVLSQRHQAEEIRRYRASHIFEDIDSEQTSLLLRYRVEAGGFDRGGEATSKLKRTLERLGISLSLLRRVTISSYEAEMNLIIHTTNGGELKAIINPQRLVIITEDDGPGIDDAVAVFKPGFTTAADWVRELGFGAGMGLTNIQRYSDHASIESLSGRGTRLIAVFEVKPADETEKKHESRK
jgi:CBS domain-containing protein/anti-sigma regulatory factor (Ser/Thr protein kinase)